LYAFFPIQTALSKSPAKWKETKNALFVADHEAGNGGGMPDRRANGRCRTALSKQANPLGCWLPAGRYQ
jgi:hypothetical protein